MPFFDGKEIIYKKSDGSEEHGWFMLTVYGDRSISLQISHVRVHLGTHSSAPIQVDSDILDRVVWDSKNGVFRADFSGFARI